MCSDSHPVRVSKNLYRFYYILKVVKRFTHTHVHDVDTTVGINIVIFLDHKKLRDDLTRGEISHKTTLCSQTKGTPDLTPYLRRDTHRITFLMLYRAIFMILFISHQKKYCFNRMSVMQFKEIFTAAIFTVLNHYRFEWAKSILFFKFLSHLLRKIFHLFKTICILMIDPRVNLFCSKRGFDDLTQLLFC